MAENTASKGAATSVRQIFDEISLRVISFLEKRTGVTDIQFFEREAASTKDIDDWNTANYPCRLPEDLSAFLSLSDGLLLRWHCKFHSELLPLGCMHLNPIKQLKKVALCDTFDEMRTERPGEAFVHTAIGRHGVPHTQQRGTLGSESPAQNSPSVKAMFDLDSTCTDGRVLLVYDGALDQPSVWFQDHSCHFYFIARSFTDYFRLMIMHLGLPHWHYAFTDVGLDPVSKQWFRFLSPERLLLDLHNARSVRAAQALRPKPPPQPPQTGSTSTTTATQQGTTSNNNKPAAPSLAKIDKIAQSALKKKQRQGASTADDSESNSNSSSASALSSRPPSRRRPSSAARRRSSAR